MAKIRVGVIRGGPSAEYDISLKTGENILKYLPQEKYKPVDIFVSKNGEWYWKGIVMPHEKIFRHIDVIFNALHGEYGEDGEVQKILETYNMPYTGSGVFASRIAMKKGFARELFKQYHLLVPAGMKIKKASDIEKTVKEVFHTFPLPWVVKPEGRGSSIGVSVVKNINDLKKAIIHALTIDATCLTETYIAGREATCAVLENFRDQSYYAMPVVEIIPPKQKKFFDYESKYDGNTEEICPGRFNHKTTLAIQNATTRAHIVLGCRHYSRSDFIIDKQGRVWLLETNTLPGLTSESLLPKSAAAIGCSFPQLLDHIVSLALKN